MMADEGDKRDDQRALRDRQERLKLALRDNLKRRKSQARDRAKMKSKPSNDHEDALDHDT